MLLLSQQISRQKFLPLFSHVETKVMRSLLAACYRAGVRCFEFTNRTENAPDVFYELLKFKQETMPDLILGVGTIKTPVEAELFHTMGASFLVSPLISKELLEFTRKKNIQWIPGCASASEIGLAENEGLSLVKIFPITQLGGTGFLKAMKEVFPKMNFLPTGGIKPDKEEINNWIDAGALGVGLGSRLFQNATEEELIKSLSGLMK